MVANGTVLTPACGLLTVQASSSYTDEHGGAIKGAFDFDAVTFWHSQDLPYVYTDAGQYTGNTTTAGRAGEWLQLSIPCGLRLSGYSLLGRQDQNLAEIRSPRNFSILVRGACSCHSGFLPGPACGMDAMQRSRRRLLPGQEAGRALSPRAAGSRS